MFYWNLLYYIQMEMLNLLQLWGFNPCFIGTYSITVLQEGQLWKRNMCFNPCFIGTYSITGILNCKILIVQERFNPCFIGTYSITWNCFKWFYNQIVVLILVLLELTLLLYLNCLLIYLLYHSFNPCFIGTYSITPKTFVFYLFFNMF